MLWIILGIIALVVSQGNFAVLSFLGLCLGFARFAEWFDGRYSG